MKRTALLIALLALGLGAPPACSGPQTSGKARSSKRYKKSKRLKTPLGTRMVERVIDGDTVELNRRARVRVNHINTPEIDEELGREAKEFAKALVLERMVKVEGNTKDGYGRIIGDLVVDGTSLAEQLVQNGLAHVFLIPPVEKDKAKRLLAAQHAAREERLGIWRTARYKGAFHLTSLHANPKGNDNFNLNGEYVRICCIADAPQSLKGYALKNRLGETYVFDDVVVPPGYTVVLHSGHGDDQLDHNKQIKLFWKRERGAWRNKGDTATMLDTEGQPIDELVYDPKKRKNYRN